MPELPPRRYPTLKGTRWEPSWPGEFSLSVQQVNPTQVSISWTPSIQAESYELYVDGVLVQTFALSDSPQLYNPVLGVEHTLVMIAVNVAGQFTAPPVIVSLEDPNALTTTRAKMASGYKAIADEDLVILSQVKDAFGLGHGVWALPVGRSLSASLGTVTVQIS